MLCIWIIFCGLSNIDKTTLGRIQNELISLKYYRYEAMLPVIGALSLYSEICISMSTSKLFYMLIWWQESLIKILWGNMFLQSLSFIQSKAT